MRGCVGGRLCVWLASTNAGAVTGTGIQALVLASARVFVLLLLLVVLLVLVLVLIPGLVLVLGLVLSANGSPSARAGASTINGTYSATCSGSRNRNHVSL